MHGHIAEIDDNCVIEKDADCCKPVRPKLYTADCKYITKEQEKDIIERLSEIGRMLNSMMKKADKSKYSEAKSPVFLKGYLK